MAARSSSRWRRSAVSKCCSHGRRWPSASSVGAPAARPFIRSSPSASHMRRDSRPVFTAAATVLRWTPNTAAAPDRPSFRTKSCSSASSRTSCTLSRLGACTPMLLSPFIPAPAAVTLSRPSPACLATTPRPRRGHRWPVPGKPLAPALEPALLPRCLLEWSHLPHGCPRFLSGSGGRRPTGRPGSPKCRFLYTSITALTPPRIPGLLREGARALP